MRVAATRIGLERGLVDRVPAVQAPLETAEGTPTGVGVMEAETSLERRGRADDAGPREALRDDAVIGGETDVEALVPRAVLEKLHRAGGLTQRDSERVLERGGQITGEVADRRRHAGGGVDEAAFVLGRRRELLARTARRRRTRPRSPPARRARCRPLRNRSRHNPLS